MPCRLETLLEEHKIDLQPGDSGEEDEVWLEHMLNCGLEDGGMVGGTIAHGNKLTRVHARSGRKSHRAKKSCLQESGHFPDHRGYIPSMKPNHLRESRAERKEALEGLAKKHRHKNRGKRSESPGKSDRMRKSTTASASGGSSEGLSLDAGKVWQSTQSTQDTRQGRDSWSGNWMSFKLLCFPSRKFILYVTA